jgi:hypothetical protein
MDCISSLTHAKFNERQEVGGSKLLGQVAKALTEGYRLFRALSGFRPLLLPYLFDDSAQQGIDLSSG